MAQTAKIPTSRGKVLPDLTAPQPDTNGPGRDEVLFMMGQFLAAQSAIKAAQNANKRLRSQAKLRGFNLEQFDRAIAERERDDGTTVDNLKDFKRYCEFMGLPVGSQITLFDDPQSGTAFSEEQLLQRAYEEGYELGVMGKNADEQAYPPMTPEGQEHMAGWHQGQKVCLDKFVKLNEDLAAADAAKTAKKTKKKNGKGADPEPDGEGDADGETKH